MDSLQTLDTAETIVIKWVNFYECVKQISQEVKQKLRAYFSSTLFLDRQTYS